MNSGKAVEADGEIAERGHDLWAVAGPDLGVVLRESHITDPVESVLYRPVPPDHVGRLGCDGVVVGQVGDRVHGLPADPGAAKRSAGAGDLDRQRGTGKAIPAGIWTSFTVRVSTRP